MAQYGGRFPRDVETLQALPGVGRYTAGAVASIAFGVRAPVLDGNVKRVLARLFDVAESIDDAGTTCDLLDLADELVPRTAPGDFNQAMMELGARVCVPRNPRCDECPVRAYCLAYAHGVQNERPVRHPRKPIPYHESWRRPSERTGAT